jgi:hypothetical protein
MMGAEASKPAKAPVAARTATTSDAVSKADTDVIKLLLGKLGYKPATLGDAYKLVKDVTGYDWKVENVTGIVKTLEEKIDASNA